MYINQSLKKYIEDLADRTPTPGGGSVASLSSCLGCALIIMVCKFTLGNQKYKEVEADIEEAIKKIEPLRLRLMELIDLDISAYKEVLEAYKLPKEDKERKAKIEKTIHKAISVPLEICRLSVQALKICMGLLEKVNIKLISDLSVSASLLRAGFQSALVNVEINLSSLKDEDFIINIRKILEPLAKESEILADEIIKKVKEKIIKMNTK